MNQEATDAAEWYEDSGAGRRLDRLGGEKMTGRDSLREFVSCHHRDEDFSVYIGQGAGRKGTITCQSSPHTWPF